MSAKDYGLQIVVLTSGFVYIGLVSVETNGWLTIEQAKSIRTWGSSKGLGELRNGPTIKTVLDECGTVIAPPHALIHFIACFDGWEKHYKRTKGKD